MSVGGGILCIVLMAPGKGDERLKLTNLWEGGMFDEMNLKSKLYSWLSVGR